MFFVAGDPREPALCSGVDLVTERLRLVEIGPDCARDLWRVLSDPAVAESYGNEPTLSDAERIADEYAWSWEHHGVHKWMAYDRATGEPVGRGGCSRVPVDPDWGRLYKFLPDEDWVAEVYPSSESPVHKNWVEIGWALRRPFWGQGLATEIGRAGLDFAFRELQCLAVVSCTEVPNERSRAVMGRIGMAAAGRVGGGVPTAEISDTTIYTVHVLLADARYRRCSSPSR